MELKHGSLVWLDGYGTLVCAISVRQNREMCAWLVFADGSGTWVEVSRLEPLPGGSWYSWSLSTSPA